MAKLIRFSIANDIGEKLQKLVLDGESIDLVAKRLVLEALGESKQHEIEKQFEQRLTELEERLNNRIDKIEILSALKTEIETGNLRPSPTRTNK